MESRKRILMNSFSGQQWRNRHREQIYGHSGRRGGRKGDGWREYLEIYNTIRKIDHQWELAV